MADHDPTGVTNPPLASRRLARSQALSRLQALDRRGELTTAHVRLVASPVGVSLRTVWRWLEAARVEGRTGPAERDRFTITPELHARLAAWCGNAAAVHRELQAEYAEAVAEGREVPQSPPSLATLHRAIRLDLNPGQRAALAGGERARRRHDVHLRRPKQWRNACWEADHKHIPVAVLLDGQRVFPWVTWFVDCATKAITGAAITPHQPSRDAILAALRMALQRDNNDENTAFGPIGGLPALVRIDRGSDFLSHTVAQALGAFAVPIQDLPAYHPELKGTVENLNRCAQRMFFAALPGYTHAPTASMRPGTTRGGRVPVGELMEFSVFVEQLLEWISWWNTEHASQALGGRTPLEAWQQDPTPIHDVDRSLLWAFTLEDDGRIRTLTTSGVRFNNRYYVGEWMAGDADAGTKVRVRCLPHHDHEIEVFDAATGKHLGTAHLAGAATDAQRRALRRSKDAEKRRLARALAQASRHTRPKYAAVTQAEQPTRLGTLTSAEADQALTTAHLTNAAELSLPDLIPPTTVPSHWRTPAPRSARSTNPGEGEPIQEEQQ
ncbi:Mu transposase C-terminal domain-containing protein [Streptomyces sp. KLOTTS4A1]|uniref:Mu transposase C-terminal domain-containing protein n=1 Tax=Streptomyces sp. KLOTTS4A1 TaxID=3390996 RepID=UPI0039F4EEC2